MKNGTAPADLLAFQVRAARLTEPEREVKFHPTRKWRADFCWREHRLLVEVEGGLYLQGRHSRGAGFEADMVKYAHAMLLGWKVLRVSPRHIQQGTALQWIARLLDKASS